MKKIVMVAILAALCLGVGTASADLITNGDFSGGNAGFTSAYTYHDVGYNALWPEGTYGVGTNPNAYHSLWAGFGDHTTGQGKMMIVNGATSGANAVVWASTATVEAGKTYYFSAWVTSVYPPPVGSGASAPALLAFSINGTELIPDIATSITGNWSLFYRSWVANGTMANLSLINRTADASGNDFAIDDLGLDTRIPSVPEPTTMLLLGLGLVGLAGIRRKL